MKVALYYDKDNIQIQETPIPEIEDTDILLKVKVCGICGTDLDKIVNKKVQEKTVLGHEVAGDVIKVGRAVTRFKEGDKIHITLKGNTAKILSK